MTIRFAEARSVAEQQTVLAGVTRDGVDGLIVAASAIERDPERKVIRLAANEGKLVAIIGPGEAEAVVGRMRRHPLGVDASAIGVVTEQRPKMVIMRTRVGGTRVVDLHPGKILPRIC